MTDVMTKQWFIVHTYSGFEKKVKQSLEQRVKAYGLADEIGEILIPTEDVIEMRGGQESGQLQALLPGLSAGRDDDVGRRLARRQEHAEGDRVRRRRRQADAADARGSRPDPAPGDGAAEKPKPKYSFEKGDQVRINEGPFTNFNGVVDEVNTEKNTLKVMVTIFGRSTPVELDFLQVEKL